MHAPRILLLLLLPVALALSAAAAQAPVGSGREDEGYSGPSLIRIEEGVIIDENAVRTAREVASHSTGTPLWTNPPGFDRDVFTFARVLFKSAGRPGDSTRFVYGRGPNLGWWVDIPDADLNFSYRLQQMTSIRTNPDGRVIRLTDPDLPDYPF